MDRYLIGNSALKSQNKSIISLSDFDTSASNYESGIKYLQMGLPLEAADYFKKVIAESNNNYDAHYHLAYCYQQLNKDEQALEEYRLTLDLNPLKTDALINTGIILGDQKNFKDAEKCFDLVLKVDPKNIPALINLGNLKSKLKEFDNALSIYSELLKLDNENPKIFYNLGNIYQEISDYEKSERNYYSVLFLEPLHFGAITNLGMIYFKQKIYDKALFHFNKALELEPEKAINYFNIANIYRDLQKDDIALLFYKRAIDKDAKLGLACVYIADILYDKGNIEEAQTYYNLAAGDGANKAISFTNLGLEMLSKYRFKEALRYFDVALTVDENIPEVHYNKSYAYLVQGEFEKGWEEYEWRLKRPDWIQGKLQKPFLNTHNIGGKKILVTDEQGLGDSIQFSRYLPMLKNKGAYVIYECFEKLSGLYKNLDGVDKLVEKNNNLEPEFEYDFHIPLLSLPNYFNTTSDNIPRPLPHFPVEDSLINYWRNKLTGRNNFSVGLVWAGNPANTNDKNRSCLFKNFIPFLSVSGIDFYSLQKGNASSQLTENTTRVIDLSKDINTFEDTAAIISNLDLVITVDTSIAHLAGALGKPVWVMLPYLPDWRWLLNRIDSPWYPTMKLFRQQKLDCWEEVIQDIKDKLLNRFLVRDFKFDFKIN